MKIQTPGPFPRNTSITGTEENTVLGQSWLTVAYGRDPRQTIDIYLPANRSVHKTSSLVLIHGGGWTSGSKADFALYIDNFRKRLPGYAIFNLGYRLVDGGNLFPTQEEDVRAALDLIAARAVDYGVNAARLSVLGFSAGAHLALLQAYKSPSPRIRAVIDYFGPTDLVAMYQQPWHPLVPVALQMITGTSPDVDAALFQASSPAHFVSAQSPPTLILHGGKDPVVDVSQSISLAAKLKQHQVQHKLVVYPLAGHGRWAGKTLADSFDEVVQFLEGLPDPDLENSPCRESKFADL